MSPPLELNDQEAAVLFCRSLFSREGPGSALVGSARYNEIQYEKKDARFLNFEGLKWVNFYQKSRPKIPQMFDKSGR